MKIKKLRFFQILLLTRSSAFNTVPSSKKKESVCSTLFIQPRRDIIQFFFGAINSVALITSSPTKAIAAESTTQPSLQNYFYTDDWQGTSLELLSYQQATALSNNNPTFSYDMGRWPDPILRRPASPIPLETIKDKNVNYVLDIANALRRTARKNGAVGLAAQQCGIDLSMIFLDDPKLLSNNIFSGKSINTGGTFLVNPRIIARSSELEMKVWNEQCLVLPPTFRATVLRDAVVNVQYENLKGERNEITLTGELARALQHELDHDRGILILDHVGLNELENGFMRRIEERGHDERQVLAYSRFVSDPNSDGRSNTFTAIRETIIPNANARSSDNIHSKRFENASNENKNTNSNCDEACMQERKRIIEKRRAMMNQSRSNTQRSQVFELSKQRAALYGTKYQGASCPPNLPCI